MKFIITLICCGFVYCIQAQSQEGKPIKTERDGETQVKLDKPGGSKASSVFLIKGKVLRLKQEGIIVSTLSDYIDEKVLAEKARQEYLKGKFAKKEKPAGGTTITVFIYGDPSQYIEGQAISVYCANAGTWTGKALLTTLSGTTEVERTYRAFKRVK